MSLIHISQSTIAANITNFFISVSPMLFLGEEYKINIHFYSDHAGFYEQLLVFKFKTCQQSSEKFDIMRLLEVIHRTHFSDEILPTAGNSSCDLQTVKWSPAKGYIVLYCILTYCRLHYRCWSLVLLLVKLLLPCVLSLFFHSSVKFTWLKPVVPLKKYAIPAGIDIKKSNTYVFSHAYTHTHQMSRRTCLHSHIMGTHFPYGDKIQVPIM